MFKKALKVIVVGIMVAIVLVVGAIAGVVMLFDELDPPVVLRSLESPDGRYVAHYMKSDGGATTKAGFHTVLAEKGAKPSLRSDGHVAWSYNEMTFKWISPDGLEVTSPNGDMINYRKSSFRDVFIVDMF